MRQIQLTKTISFIYSIDDKDEECVMHSKSDNIEIVINDEADKVSEELFNSFKNRYQLIWRKNRWKAMISYLIMFIYYIKNVIK